MSLRQVGVALNPYGVTRGTILACIIFIFLTWAVTPDVFYGTTYYFYLSPENAYAVCYDTSAICVCCT